MKPCIYIISYSHYSFVMSM